jgi:hypothetical protein
VQIVLDEPTDADRARFARVTKACTQAPPTTTDDVSKLCPPTTARERLMCIRICEDAIDAAARAKFPPPQATAVTAPTPLPPPKPEDPYDRALRACIAGVRERGDPPVCRFDRPLDDMDFGQRHCNARCALQTVLARDAAP